MRLAIEGKGGRFRLPAFAPSGHKILGKLFTHMCLCHQAAHTCLNAGKVTAVCGRGVTCSAHSWLQLTATGVPWQNNSHEK